MVSIRKRKPSTLDSLPSHNPLSPKSLLLTLYSHLLCHTSFAHNPLYSQISSLYSLCSTIIYSKTPCSWSRSSHSLQTILNSSARKCLLSKTLPSQSMSLVAKNGRKPDRGHFTLFAGPAKWSRCIHYVEYKNGKLCAGLLLKKYTNQPSWYRHWTFFGMLRTKPRTMAPLLRTPSRESKTHTINFSRLTSSWVSHSTTQFRNHTSDKDL